MPIRPAAAYAAARAIQGEDAPELTVQLTASLIVAYVRADELKQEIEARTPKLSVVRES